MVGILQFLISIFPFPLSLFSTFFSFDGLFLVLLSYSWCLFYGFCSPLSSLSGISVLHFCKLRVSLLQFNLVFWSRTLWNFLTLRSYYFARVWRHSCDIAVYLFQFLFVSHIVMADISRDAFSSCGILAFSVNFGSTLAALLPFSLPPFRSVSRCPQRNWDVVCTVYCCQPPAPILFPITITFVTIRSWALAPLYASQVSLFGASSFYPLFVAHFFGLLSLTYVLSQSFPPAFWSQIIIFSLNVWFCTFCHHFVSLAFVPIGKL